MNLLAPISTIMQTNLITVSEADNLWTVANILHKYHIHHVLVVEGRKLLGIVSLNDVLLKRQHDDLNDDKARLESLQVKNVMITGIGKLEPTDRINVALSVFKENLFHALPVVEGEEIVGLVTTHDFIKHLDEDKEIVETYKGL